MKYTVKVEYILVRQIFNIGMKMEKLLPYNRLMEIHLYPGNKKCI
jgi:hypothetical protein